MSETEAIRTIFKTNLAVKPLDRVLIFTDRIAKHETNLPTQDATRREALRHIARLAEGVALGLCKEVRFLEYPAPATHGVEPPRKLWDSAFGPRAVAALVKAGLLAPLLKKKATREALDAAAAIIAKYKNDAATAVVGLSNFSTSHTTFRTLLTKHAGARYASMPLFDPSMLTGAMRVDYRAMASRTRKLATLMSQAEHVRIKTKEGTQITMSLQGRRAQADTGLLSRPGSFGNLPAGEAYVAPLEGTAEGKLVLLWAPTRKLAYPVTLTVANGMVTGVEGRELYADALRAKLAENPLFKNIAELGIGTNERASRPDNILESEKILGTIHIALGDNSSFGGIIKTPFHQDFVFFGPTVTLIMKDRTKKVILDRGKMSL